MDKQALQNLRTAIENKDFFTDINDNHIVTPEEREKIILPFDILRRNPINKIKNLIADKMFKSLAHKVNITTEILGAENLTSLGNTGAIIISNHFHPLDCFINRYWVDKTIKKKIYFVVAEHNLFMGGKLGAVIKQANIIPISMNLKYLKNNYEKCLAKIFKRKQSVAISAEQSMWVNYTKPRPTKIGAYHYAVKYNVPIIPVFITMELDKNGEVKYTVHILPLLFPDRTKDARTAKQELQAADYNARVKLYEDLTHKKLTYDYEDGDIFNPDEDIFARIK
jgi:1-acyl-sn-glycerol-3-phosphate acyltransferase